MTVLLSPIINEKSMSLIKQNLYTFKVARTASKDQISKEVKAKFGVEVLAVRTINLAGKNKIQRTKRAYYITTPLRKAIVQIKKGQKIAVFEVASEKESFDKTQDKEVEVRTGEGERVSVKEKKSLLSGTKVRIEKQENQNHPEAKRATGRPGKTKGDK